MNEYHNPLDAGPSRLPIRLQVGHIAGAEVIGSVNPAWKHKVIKSSNSAFEPSQEAGAGGLHKLELHGPAGLLLDDDRSKANPAATDKVANLDFDDVAGAQIAVDRQIE